MAAAHPGRGAGQAGGARAGAGSCSRRTDPTIAWEILEFMEKHGVLSVAMTDGIIGCPHQQGIDYEGEWSLICEFWHGRDRFTGAEGPLILRNRVTCRSSPSAKDVTCCLQAGQSQAWMCAVERQQKILPGIRSSPKQPEPS